MSPFIKPFVPRADAENRSDATEERRKQKPVFVDRLPPCNQTCPAGENIQKWLSLAEDGHYRQAWEEILQNNPFPATVGRVCYHPCELACNRKELDKPVNIHALERFLGDEALSKGWKIETPQPTGKKVAIIGAGPSGLSAAYHLIRFGHRPTLFEAGPKPGGMMRFGIPKYRLPRNILDGEISRILAMGGELKLNTCVKDVESLFKQNGGEFDAVFMAIGAHISKNIDIPAKDAIKITDASAFLRQLEVDGKRPHMGRRVAIYGGGNTAMDAARTAKRLGADEVMVIYRRDWKHMKAKDFEAQEALDEGIAIKWLRTIKKVEGETLTIERMGLDEKGQLIPTGEFETLEADAVVLAIGQDVDSEFLKKVPNLEFKKDGTLRVSSSLMTGYSGLFAGGDMVPADRTVTNAIGHGKKAARTIDAFVRGETYRHPDKPAVSRFHSLNISYYEDVPRSKQGVLDQYRRKSGFEEVLKGLDEDTAHLEAKRCLSCGNCFECDICFKACPDDAINKLGEGKRYEFNYDNCTGCGTCIEECPCGAIEAQVERT